MKFRTAKAGQAEEITTTLGDFIEVVYEVCETDQEALFVLGCLLARANSLSARNSQIPRTIRVRR
jgi:hypothetical protein